MRTLSKFASTAALALATTLVLSCSSDDGGDSSTGSLTEESSSSGGVVAGVSSSSVGGSVSSSSVGGGSSSSVGNGESSSSVVDVSFAGVWNASDNRSCTFTGNSFDYKVNGTTKYSGTFSVSGSTITWTVSGVSVTSNFTLSENTLTLSNHSYDSSINGTYTKDNGGGSSSSSGDGGSSSSMGGDGGGGNVVTPTGTTGIDEFGSFLFFGFTGSKTNSSLQGFNPDAINTSTLLNTASCGFTITSGGSNVLIYNIQLRKPVGMDSDEYAIGIIHDVISSGQQATISYTPNGTHIFKTADGKTLGAFTLTETAQ